MPNHEHQQKWTDAENALIMRLANPYGRHAGFPNGKAAGKQDWQGMEKKFAEAFPDAGYKRTANMLRNRYHTMCDQNENELRARVSCELE